MPKHLPAPLHLRVDRQEQRSGIPDLLAAMAQVHVRVAVVEPGATATELASHVREEVRQQLLQRYSGFELLAAEDIAEATGYIVTRPRRVAVNELVIRPSEEEA